MNSDRSPSGSGRLYRLQIYEEISGQLIELKNEDGFLVAAVGRIKVMLPLELKEPLQALLGRRLAIIRTDRDFRWRVLSSAREFGADEGNMGQ
jgi:hypothetical protein